MKIITRLSDIGIDVLTDDYHSFDDTAGHVTPLSAIKSTLEQIMTLDEIKHKNVSQSMRIINLANEFNTFFHNNIAYVGQLLIDFSNGSVFKAALLERNIDGYIFEEEIHTHKPTYCLFDYSNLSAPIHEIVYT